MKFNLNDYIGKYVMHCKTKEEAKDFCNYLHEHGKKWGDGASYKNKTNYKWHGTHTVYYFNENYFGTINYAMEEDYKILEWSDFMDNTFTKKDLRNWDVVQYRNGIEAIVCLDLGVLISAKGFNSLHAFREDLTSGSDCVSFDIVAVRRPKVGSDCQLDKAFKYHAGDLVYEREAVEEMTLEEVCRLLGKDIKIIK